MQIFKQICQAQFTLLSSREKVGKNIEMGDGFNFLTYLILCFLTQYIKLAQDSNRALLNKDNDDNIIATPAEISD